MNLLDNPQIRDLVNYAMDNGFIPSPCYKHYFIRINYTFGSVFIFQDENYNSVIIDHYSRLNTQLVTKINVDTFRLIFIKRFEGKG